MPENNIELGSTYIAALKDVYFSKIGNAVSREYCAISGYNTGPSNVYRTFNKNKSAAINSINKMQPPEVFAKLKGSLPYAETRKYLTKVVNNRRQYIGM